MAAGAGTGEVETMSKLASEVEKRIADVAGVYVAVEESEGALVLSGIVGSAGERQAALDIAAELAPRKRIEDNMEAGDVLPREVDGLTLSETDMGAFTGATRGLSQRGGLEAGDFTDQALMTDPLAASGAGPSSGPDVVSEGGESYVPPIDPVGSTTEVVGGFETSSMDDVDVERAEYGGTSDESIAEAVRRELREDSATADLQIEVHVRHGVVHLRGKVFSIDDAENAEAVAARVPGVDQVRELLDVEATRVL
ncbi:MAG: hypothetical protein C0506_07070 [Anaerolinea sp.]|nr:hypothetical protein [Anaerolinea sp.]